MKCEICHESEAKQAIVRHEDGVENELYVCESCAAKERIRRQKKSQRTRKGVGGGCSGVSITVGSVPPGIEPPPFIGALLNAVNGMVSEITGGDHERRRAEKDTPKFKVYSCRRVPVAFRLGDRLHLEGLSLVGDIECVHRAIRALNCRLVAYRTDGVREPGHVYAFEYGCDSDRAARIVDELVRQERSARIHLLEACPRQMGDAICRSLALLKNCRLLAVGELFDLLSPIRLALRENLLDGITLRRVEDMLSKLDMSDGDNQSEADFDERDRIDAERADNINRIFEDVVLNERAERKFL